MLARKTYIGDSNNILAKNYYLHWGLNLRPLMPSWLSLLCTACKTRSLHSYTLLILAKSSKSKSRVHKQKVNLNISQLTLAKAAQSGMPQSRTQEVPCSIPTRGNFFSEYILLFPLLTTLPIMYNYGKTPLFWRPDCQCISHDTIL